MYSKTNKLCVKEKENQRNKKKKRMIEAKTSKENK